MRRRRRRELLKDVYDLHALATIEAERAWYLEHGRLSPGRSKAITALVNELCAAVRPPLSSSSTRSAYRAGRWMCRWLYRRSMSEPIEPASAAEAARELARVLLEQADALDLHDLRATGAIENVRVQARALADAVHERGWGDIFLGIDSYDPDELDDLPLGPDDFDDPADYREIVEGAAISRSWRSRCCRRTGSGSATRRGTTMW